MTATAATATAINKEIIQGDYTMNKALKELIVELAIDYYEANKKATELQGKIDLLEEVNSHEYDTVILRKDLEKMFGWAPLPQKEEEKGEN